MLMFMLLISTLLVNSFPTLVLFDSGAIRSFVSQSFRRGFDMTLGELECPLRVSISNEHMISASSISGTVIWRILGFLIQLI